MKWAYFALSVASCLLGAAYVADRELLLGALWLTSGVTNGIIAVMIN
jgi:hypothetical protein